MEVKTIIWLLFAHWIADFVCQSDWMAQNKSKDFMALFIHCSVYTAIVWGFSILLNNSHPITYKFPMWIFLGHIATDAITSRINSKLWAAKKVHWFFVSVGFDQWIHFVTLILVYKYLVN